MPVFRAIAQSFSPALMRLCTTSNSSGDRTTLLALWLNVVRITDRFVGVQGGTIGWPRAWWNWLTRRL